MKLRGITFHSYADADSLALRRCLLSSGHAAAQNSQSADHWTDSVLATLSLRDRAAQMVWPNLMADYVAADAPQWHHLSAYVNQEHVGGLLMSVGSPIEMAAKLNALQRMSPLPLLVGADLETGAGMRARGGYFVPNGIDLGGGTLFPPNMALGATGDTTLAYDAGWVTAIEGRALGIQIDFAPVLDVNNNSANPVINTRSYGEDPHAVAHARRVVHPRVAGPWDDRYRETFPGSWRHRYKFSPRAPGGHGLTCSPRYGRAGTV